MLGKLFALVLILMSFSIHAQAPSTVLNGLPDGVYRGFGPTDESAVRVGELELTVKDNVAQFKMATGLKVHSEEGSLAGKRILTDGKVIFVYTGGMGDFITPLILYPPDQVA